MGTGSAGDLMSTEKSLRDYINVILRRVWVVVAVFISVVLITVIYAWTRTPLYTSVATVELEEKSAKIKDRDSVYGRRNMINSKATSRHNWKS